MKYLIAGLGSVGRRHMRNLIALGETDIVLYRTHKATLPDDELEGHPVETDLIEALRKHKPDAVIVSNPTSMHLDVAITAAETGCAILLEKPIAASMERVDVLQKAVQKSGSKVLVAFQFRFHPGMVKTKELIQTGEIGRVVSASVHFGEYLPAWHPWEDYRKGYAARSDMGGGVVATQCHSLDYLPWLVGKKVESVWGFAAKLSDLEVTADDTSKIGLRFEGGALGSLHLDYNQQPPEHEFRVIGTNGTIKWNLADGSARIYRTEKKDWDVFPLPAGWERNVMFQEQTRHFIDIVEGKAAPSCTLEDGVQVQKIISSVHESQKTGRLIALK
ncbi:MAG: gfo/Idh/MocA family oxidoreductase [Chloroflexi bacterium]|nr:MAG: gfo/Idh/MocA family oxidoreductase [Chloroflexota bacterium]